MKKIVVIGSSIAGLNGIDVIRQRDKEAEIILISDETDIYSKCIMHYYMNGERTKEGLSFVGEDFMETNRVNWMKGQKAVRIDTEAKLVILKDGQKVSYDDLLLAVGSDAFVPPIEGIEGVKNIYPFHTLDDCEIIMEKAQTASNVVILGAGLVGVDVAKGLIGLTKNITIMDMKDHMLSIQLDDKAAAVYEKAFRENGVDQIYGVGVKAVEADSAGNVQNVILTDGRKLACDLLIIAAGTRANKELAEASGIETDKFGVIIDTCCRTSADHVYAAGDVTGRDMVWPAAAKEAMVAAFNITGTPREMTDFFKGKSTINIFDVPTMSFGIPNAPDASYTEEIKEGTDGSYQKIIHKEGKIYGVILQKDLFYTGILNQIISTGTDLTSIKKPLLDLDYADLMVMEGVQNW